MTSATEADIGFLLTTIVEMPRGLTDAEVYALLAARPGDDPAGVLARVADESNKDENAESETGFTAAEARDLLAGRTTLTAGFDPREPRDEEGRWAHGPGVKEVERSATAFLRSDGSVDVDAVAKHAADRVREVTRIGSSSPRVSPTPPAPVVVGSEPSTSEVAGFVKRLARARGDGGALKSVKSAEKLSRRNDAARAAIESYQVDARTINGSLRHGTPVSPWDGAVITQLSDVMRESRLSHDVKVSRIVVEPERIFGDAWCRECDNSGLTWIDHGFTSTTTNESVAARIHRVVTSRGFQEPVQMTVLAPRGTPALYLDVSPTISWQDEILLDRGNGYRIVRDRGVDDEGLRHIDVEVVPRSSGGSLVSSAARSTFGDDGTDSASSTGANGDDVDLRDAHFVDDGPEVEVLIRRKQSNEESSSLTAGFDPHESRDPEGSVSTSLAANPVPEPVESASEEHTGAMVALVPSAASAERLAVPGGESASELHCTLCYLGEAANLPPEARALLLDEVTAVLRGLPPLTVSAFSVNLFNPPRVGGADGKQRDTCVVLGLSGEGLDELHDVVEGAVDESGVDYPEQHEPWTPHVTLAYVETTDLAEYANRVGPVTFDRVRVAFGGDNYDIPLDGALAGGPGGDATTPPEPPPPGEPVDGTGPSLYGYSETGGGTMPYSIARRGDEFCVVKATDDSVVKCHPDRASAARHLRALYANVPDAGAEELALDDNGKLTVPNVLVDLTGWLTWARERDVNEPAGPGHQLRDYWVYGEGAAKIRWNTEGDGTRCIRHLRKYVRDPGGLCQEYHRLATGTSMHPHPGRPTEALDVEITIHELPPGHAPATPETHDEYANWVGDCDCPPANKEMTMTTPVSVEAAGAVTPGPDGSCPPGYNKMPNGVCLPTLGKHTAAIAPGAAPGDCPPGHHMMPDGRCMPGESMPPAAPVRSTPTPPVPGGAYAASTNLAPWEGVLTVEGRESGDGRKFAPNSLTWDAPPLPLMWQKETSHGGQSDVSVRVGSVTSVWRQPDPSGSGETNLIMGRGFIDLDNPDGAEAHRRMMNKTLSGNSVDVDSVKDADVELVYARPDELAGDQVGVTAEGDVVDIPAVALFAAPELTVYHRGRIRGTTLVEYPAFTDARLSLSTNPASGGGPVVDALVAAAYTVTIPDLPPTEWFEEPVDVMPRGAFTVTREGRVYGYLAPEGVRHRSFADRPVYVPTKKVDYSRFLGGETIVADGGRVVTGPITMNCGHLPPVPGLTTRDALEHYENSCSVVASVRVGRNDRGVWVAGALLPGVTPDQVARMMVCRLSGDWRPHLDRPGWRELAAMLLVPTPGFPLGRSAPSVRVNDGALVASGVPVRLADTEDREYDIRSGTAPACGHTTVAAVEGVDPRVMARRIALSIGRDPARVRAARTARLTELRLRRVACGDLSTDARREAADKGEAMPDGSYPIRNVAELQDAIRAYGRAKNKEAVKRFIERRARELGREDLIPDAWKAGSAELRTAVAALLRRREAFAFNPAEKRGEHGRWTRVGDVVKKVLKKSDVDLSQGSNTNLPHPGSAAHSAVDHVAHPGDQVDKLMNEAAEAVQRGEHDRARSLRKRAQRLSARSPGNRDTNITKLTEQERALRDLGR